MRKTPTHPLDATFTSTPPDTGRRRALRGLAAALGGGLSLAGCGGGGDAGPDAIAAQETLKQALGGIDSGGTGRAANLFVSAPIDNANPLTLNGMPYDSTGTLVVDADDHPLILGQLMPGMSGQLSAVRGGRPSPALPLARSLRVADELLAPVDSVDIAQNSFSALGQRVVLTASTALDASLPGGLASVLPGTLVRVWGQLDVAGGRTVATRLAAVGAADSLVLRGVLSQLDLVAGRARIGRLVLRWDTADAGVVDAAAAVGAVVRARLVLAAAGASGEAQLLSLRADALRLPDRVEAELEGRITRLDSPTRFAVDGVPVDASGAAFAAGASTLVLGQRVSVRGRSSQGLLLATSVQAEADEALELEGSISSSNSQGNSFVLKGLTVTWTAATVFEGGTQRLLQPRRKVAVLARWNSDRTRLVATRIHVEG